MLAQHSGHWVELEAEGQAGLYKDILSQKFKNNNSKTYFSQNYFLLIIWNTKELKNVPKSLTMECVCVGGGEAHEYSALLKQKFQVSVHNQEKTPQ